MAEIQYQNPAAGNVTSQLESQLKGTAADGLTESRVQVVTMQGLLEILELILSEMKGLRETLYEVCR